MSADTRAPAGPPDREAIEASIREAAQRAQELARHAEAARAALSEAAQKVAELERQAVSAQKTVTHYQEQEREIARAMEDAQEVYNKILLSAETRAEEIIQRANVRAADEIIKSAKARAEELVAAAKSSADEIVRSARSTATDLLQKARESAQEQLQAAARTAAERRAPERSRPAEAEGDGAQAEATRKAAEEYLTGVIAKLDAFIHDRDGVSQSLEAAAKNYADSLETLGRLTTEVQSEILPAVDQLLHRLKGSTAAPAEAVAPAEAEDDTERLVPLVPSHERAKPERLATAPVSGGHHSGEVAVSPIHSFLQATKFITALSQIQGVSSVKLKSYGGLTLTLDVLTAGYAVTAIDCLQIDGFAVEVVEAEGDRLVLRLLGSPATRQVSR